MKIYAISLFNIDNNNNTYKNITVSKNLSDFNYFSRYYINEFLDFTIDLLVKSYQNNPSQFILIPQKYDMNIIYFYLQKFNDRICVIITDNDYPKRCVNILSKNIINNYNDTLDLNKIIIESKQPENVDNLMKIQKDLDETKIILIESIESILERGQKLDDLVKKTTLLSDSSKTFYSRARKMNSCCVIS